MFQITLVHIHLLCYMQNVLPDVDDGDDLLPSGSGWQDIYRIVQVAALGKMYLFVTFFFLLQVLQQIHFKKSAGAASQQLMIGFVGKFAISHITMAL